MNCKDGDTRGSGVRGGLPDSFLAASGEDSFAFRRNFIRTYLERDVAGFVIENLLAAAPEHTGASLYRTAGGAEVDLVLELPGCARPWAFEIKRGLVPRVRRGFRSALEDIRSERAFVVYGGDELLRNVGSGSAREP